MADRIKIAAGNWKMNKTPSESVEFIKELSKKVKDAKSEVIVGVPGICLQAVSEAVKGTNIKTAAQNMHWEDKGAYTGEISGPMLNDINIRYAIIGHSERRQYFGETDASVNLRTRAALKYGITPIVCVGESLLQREQGVTSEIVRYQVKIALKDISKDDAEKIIIAYEPIWAIGTGKTATSAQAQEVCALIRQLLREIYNCDIAEKVRILYGGSVTATNAAELFSQTDIDGGLVGGASLKVDDFAVISKA